MNLLVWLLFLVGTWPVVRWALQSRSHDMQKICGNCHLVGLFCHRCCLTPGLRAADVRPAAEMSSVPTSKWAGAPGGLEGWESGVLEHSAEGVASREGRCFFVTKTHLDMKTCTSIVTKQENRFVDRNGNIEATKRTDNSWQCCPRANVRKQRRTNVEAIHWERSKIAWLRHSHTFSQFQLSRFMANASSWLCHSLRSILPIYLPWSHLLDADPARFFPKTDHAQFLTRKHGHYQMNVFSGTLVPVSYWPHWLQNCSAKGRSCLQIFLLSGEVLQSPNLWMLRWSTLGLANLRRILLAVFQVWQPENWSLHCLSWFGYSTYISSCDVGSWLHNEVAWSFYSCNLQNLHQSQHILFGKDHDLPAIAESFFPTIACPV